MNKDTRGAQTTAVRETASNKGTLVANEVSHTYRKDGQVTTAIGNISLNVAQGQFVCVVGPSGCGKSTLLRILAGLLRPTEGLVEVDGSRVEGVPRTVGVVFQDYSRSL